MDFQWKYKEVPLEQLEFLLKTKDFSKEKIKDLARFDLLTRELTALTEEIVETYASEKQKEVYRLMKMKKKQWEIGVILSPPPAKPLAQFSICERIIWLQRKIEKHITKSKKGRRILREIRALIE